MTRGIKTFGINAASRRRSAGGGGVSPIAPDAVASGTLLVWGKSVIGSFYQDDAKTTPVSAVTDPIGAWADSSGNANDALQATSGQKPTYALLSGPSLPASKFLAARYDCLELADTAVMDFAQTGAYSLFAIVNFSTLTGAYIPFLGKHDGSSGWHLNSSLMSAGKIGWLWQAVSYNEVYGSTTLSAGTSYAIVASSTGVDQNGVKMWVNGVAQTTGFGGPGGWGLTTTNSAPLAVGRQAAGAVQAFDGSMGEWGAYSGAISDADAAGLSKYLTNLLGI